MCNEHKFSQDNVCDSGFDAWCALRLSNAISAIQFRIDVPGTSKTPASGEK
jgi:hypothetical protein